MLTHLLSFVSVGRCPASGGTGAWMARSRRLLVVMAALAAVLGPFAHAAEQSAEKSSASDEGRVVDKPRIAVLYNEKKRHQDEFDYALSTLGWEADRYFDKESVKSLASKLDNYDMVIIAPLFNLDGSVPLPGEDRSAYMRFIENGGLLAVTDGSYPGVRAWLADIDPRFGGLEEGKCNSSQWTINGYTTNAEPAHPLRFFPSRITEPNSWPHFLEPPKDTKWQVVARCSEGYPVTFAQTVGRGLVSLSALRQPGARQFRNFFGCLQLARAGLDLKSFELPEPAFGDGMIRLTLAENGPKQQCEFVYEIVPETGEPQRFSAAATGGVVELPYRFSVRGPAMTRLLLKYDNREWLLYERPVEMPQLLTVTPPAYRGLLSSARRLPTARFGIRLAPDQEQLQGGMVTITVLNSAGEAVSTAEITLPKEGLQLEWRQPIELDKSLPAGDYTAKAVLVDSDKRVLAETHTPFKILAPQPAQTIIDEDGTFLVNGKPFFPLGIYHVTPSDYPAVAALGLNTVQFWSWHEGRDAYGVSRGLAAASAHGLKVVYELNHKSEKIFESAANSLGSDPAILMWYGLDEPTEGSYGMAALLRDTFHREDLHHPVYTVSCVPDQFGEHAQFADVLAIDPYGKPSKAADWLPKAVAAVNGTKPVICVPGSFGKDETPEEIRATAYLALAHDARGIIWYPWEQVGGGPVGVGAKNSPEQQAAIASVCEDVKQLLPWLTAPVRQSFASEDGNLRCLYMRDQHAVILMVNPTDQVLKAEAQLPPAHPSAEKTKAKLKDFFKKREDVLEIKDGRFTVVLEPYETRVYTW